MAKTKSSSSGPKKPGKSKGGIMGLDKSSTSMGMKIIISLLILAFVSTFLYGGIASIIQVFQPNPNQPATTATDPIAAAETQFQPQVDALRALVESDPTSQTPLVNLGNAYFDWAQQVSQASQNSTTAAVTAGALWISAKDTYAKAIKIKPGDPALTIDYAIATFYSGDTAGAIAIAVPVSESNPTFAQAWLNLGVFYQASGESAKAIAAFNQYLKLDPTGKQGNADFAKEQLDLLKKTSPSTTTTP